MSNISVVRWVTPLAAVSPSSECLYEGKADVVYLQVTLCDPHLSAQWSSYTDDRRYVPLPFLFYIRYILREITVTSFSEQ